MHVLDPIGEPGRGTPLTVREEEAGLAVDAGPGQKPYPVRLTLHAVHEAAPVQAWTSWTPRSTPYVAHQRMSGRRRWRHAFSARSYAVR
ncbi:hypothetical protein SNL152K_5991 [Streptomyces sp. NL15-2K]|nr:hypothetical protein SNL152K_5991 [Streptomyces sp. NL15-2K]